jgi:hypothetical protein
MTSLVLTSSHVVTPAVFHTVMVSTAGAIEPIHCIAVRSIGTFLSWTACRPGRLLRMTPMLAPSLAGTL